MALPCMLTLQDPHLMCLAGQSTLVAQLEVGAKHSDSLQRGQLLNTCLAVIIVPVGAS